MALILKTTEEIPLKTEVTYSKSSAFMKLTKPRLSFLVVFSAVVTYLTVATQIDWIKVLSLALGGFLVTGSANGFNQVIESGLDKLMTRTQNRPLPKEILTKNEALIFC